MLDQLRSEYFRMTKYKSIYVAPAIMCVLIVLSTLVIWAFIGQFQGAQGAPAYFQANGLTGKALLISSLSTADLPLIVAILVSIVIASSFSNGAVKMSVMRGANRVELYFSKLITLVSVAVVYSVFCILVSAVASAVIGYGVTFDSNEFLELLGSFATQLWIVIAYVSFYTFLSSLIRSTGGAVVASIGVSFFMSILSTALISIGAATGKQYLIDSVQCLLSTQMTTAQSIGLETWQKLCVSLIPFGYIVLSTGFGILAFVKRDIK